MVAVLAVAIAVPATAATPGPTPSTQPGPPGVSASPAANSPYRSKSGTLLELGEVRPGQEIHDHVVLRNIAQVPQAVFVYAADAIPANGGGFAFTARGAAVSQVGRWTSLGKAELTVPAASTVAVPLLLRLPQQVQGGEYVGGIVVEPADRSASGGLQAKTRFAMAVYLTVPGGARGATPGRGRPDGRLHVVGTKVVKSGGQLCPSVSYRNDSQFVLDPTLSVDVRGPFGRHHYSERRAGAVLPDGTVTRRLPCVSRPIGPSRLRLRLASPHGTDAHDFRSTWVPLQLLIALLLLLILIGALVTTGLRGGLKRRRRDQR
jgi:hypothetical protein